MAGILKTAALACIILTLASTVLAQDAAEDAIEGKSGQLLRATLSWWHILLIVCACVLLPAPCVCWFFWRTCCSDDEFYEDDPFPYGARAYPGDGSLYRKQQALPPPYTEKDAAAHARRHARSASARASSGYPAPPSYQQSQRHSYWAGKLRSGNKRRSKMADVENQRSSYIADQQISSYMQNQPPDVVVRPEPLQQSRGSLQVTRSSVSLQGNSRESLPISSSTPSLQRTDSQKDSVVVPDNPGAVFRQSSTAPLMEN